MRTTWARVGDREDRKEEGWDIFVEIDPQHSLIWVDGKKESRMTPGWYHFLRWEKWDRVYTGLRGRVVVNGPLWNMLNLGCM